MKQQKKQENAIPAATKKPDFGLKLLHGTSKFPYKFKEIISLILPYVELINKVYIKSFQNGLQVLVGVSFQNH